MRSTTNLLIKTLVSAAMLTSLGAHAATTVEATQTQAESKQDFVGLLAKAELSKQGITDPTKAQMDAKVKSIQDQRASGMGWGAIADSMGLKLGAVVSAANRNMHADDHKRSETTDTRKGAKGAEDSRSSERSMGSETHGGKGSGSSGGGNGAGGGGSSGGGKGGGGGNGGGGKK